MTAPKDEREALARLLCKADGWSDLEPETYAGERALFFADRILAAGYTLALPASEPVAAPVDWVIRKRGLFYRPDRCGYTANIAKAGRYTEAEARAEAGIEPGVIVARPASDFADPVAAPVVTDAMVERAVDAWFGDDGYEWRDMTHAHIVRASMRAALEAAALPAPEPAPVEVQGDSAAMREALIKTRALIKRIWVGGAFARQDGMLEAMEWIDAALALPASEPVAAPVVTEEMVDRAVDAYDSQMDEMHSTYKGPMRVALEAALKP